ncbi:MAG TPA: small ribosomal subunit Rsm22 family protein, partial [Bryobacteraceae bacterium]|nr:small ribosomal subunit Rsm22 family protein [Bryobacteraceae bacterium]
GELSGPSALEVAARLWHACQVALVVIEPGTPKGFSLIRQIRDSLLAQGANMLAPCPAASPCPIASPDWCHFSQRVERSSLHRRLKDGALGYEDEKFSYVALARMPVALPPARIIRHPRHQPGLITLDLCRAGVLDAVKVPRRDRERFREARRARWGDPFSG